MKITRDELDNIKKANEFFEDKQAYEWVLKTFPESIFFHDPCIMEIINEAKEKLNELTEKLKKSR